MKAIEILKEIRDIENDYDHLKTHRFDEAIQELEALENRSCENCKHQREEFFHCNHENCRYLTHPICSRAYKDYWEAKQ